MHPARGTGITSPRKSPFRIKGNKHFVTIICEGGKWEILEMFMAEGLSMTPVEVDSPSEGMLNRF